MKPTKGSKRRRVPRQSAGQVRCLAERAAKQQKVTRSRSYAKAVAGCLKSKREKGIKEALDAVYASEPSEIDPFLAAAAYHVLSKE